MIQQDKQILASQRARWDFGKINGRNIATYAIISISIAFRERWYKHVEFHETSDSYIDHTHTDGDRILAQQPTGSFRNCCQRCGLRGLPSDRNRPGKHGESQIYQNEKQVDLHPSDFDLYGDRSSFVPLSLASCSGVAFRNGELSDAVFQPVLDRGRFLPEHCAALNRNHETAYFTEYFTPPEIAVTIEGVLL